MICRTEDRKGQCAQRGPCRGGEAEGRLARALESGECSREQSAVSCRLCFRRGGRHEGDSLPQTNPLPLIPLPLGRCTPALSHLARALPAL